MPPIDSPLLDMEVMVLTIVAVAEFFSLLRWRRRARHAKPRQRSKMALFTLSDLLVGCGLLIVFPMVYGSAWLTLFEQQPLRVGLILMIALVLIAAGIGKALLLLFTRSRAVPSKPI
jgi:nicotinamide riboside transporter PnuC